MTLGTTLGTTLGPAADDAAHMRAAFGLAARVLGETWPNPAVGCVIVSAAGRVVGRGMTAPGGRPHAETEALAMAGDAARGATAYVTLEPCSHQGETPPCVAALEAAGIARVVASVGDPDKRVDGRGFARLRAAGIAVETGLLADEGARLVAGFVTRVARGRPLVTLKLAASLDARIATASGESRWITGVAARREGHALRASHDAILVGIGTALADDPALTCKLEGARRRALVRIVADRALRLGRAAELVRTARTAPLWIVHDSGADPAREAALRAAGARLIEVDRSAGSGGAAMLAALGAEGLTRVLVEGGATLAAALLRADLVDRIAWFGAPLLLGGDALPAVAPLGIDALDAARRFTRIAARPVGDDMLCLYERSA